MLKYQLIFTNIDSEQFMFISDTIEGFSEIMTNHINFGVIGFSPFSIDIKRNENDQIIITDDNYETGEKYFFTKIIFEDDRIEFEVLDKIIFS